MPSASLWLGYYVTTRKRDDGTFRVLFEVPARLRPSDWSPQIQLPRAGFRRDDGRTVGNLNDAFEVAAIQADAAALYASLDATKKGSKAASLPAAVTRKGSIPWLIIRWGGQRLLDVAAGRATVASIGVDPGPTRGPGAPTGCSDEWASIEPRSRKFYAASVRHVFAWSITQGHKHVRGISPAALGDFLDLWNKAPGQRKNIRGVLTQLFRVAMREGEIRKSENPLDSVTAPKRKRIKGGRRVKVDRWTRDDVAVYSRTARKVAGWRAFHGKRDLRTWPGGSRCVQLMYETAADSTDVITWTQSEHLKTMRVEMPDGEVVIVEGIEFDRGKTGVPAFLPLSRDLVAEIRASGCDHLVADPFGQPYEPVVDDARLRGHLVTLREKVVDANGPRRVFDHLRHSAATEAEECGVETDKVRHLTVHKDSSMNRETYIQKSAPIAVEIQRARGLI